MSDPRPVFEARPVFKARPLLAHSHYDELMVTLCPFHKTINTFVKRLVIGFIGDLNKEAKILIDLASYRAMTHTIMTRRQCIPARLDQCVNHDPRLIFKARLVFKARLLFEEIR